MTPGARPGARWSFEGKGGSRTQAGPGLCAPTGKKEGKKTPRDTLGFDAQAGVCPPLTPQGSRLGLGDMPTTPGVRSARPFPPLPLRSAPPCRPGHTQAPPPGFAPLKSGPPEWECPPLLCKPSCTSKALRNAINYNNSDTLYFYSLCHQKISEYLKNIISLILTTASRGSWQASPAQLPTRGTADRG